MFIDTNIISKVKKGLSSIEVRRASISSVTASELMMVYSGSRTAANYYVPAVSPFHLMSSLGSSKRDHPFEKQFTDRIVFSFGNEYESLVEFGSNAIARMVNERNGTLLSWSIAFLDKKQQKMIREDFGFLIENEISCVALAPTSVKRAYRLLGEFRASGGNLKKNFRNSWNDILILSTAQDNEDDLLTEDSELARFAGSSLGRFREEGAGILRVSLDLPAGAGKKEPLESKGYLNKGWMASFRNGTPRAL